MNPSFDMQAASLVNLLRLASPALPIGAYSYSHGLEWAVTSGRIVDEASAAEWIGGLLGSVMTTCEASLMVRLYRAWSFRQEIAVNRWNQFSIASRETSELSAETLQTGYSLSQLLCDLGLVDSGRLLILKRLTSCSFPCVYALAAVVMSIPEFSAALGLLWAWLENQVAAAIKVIPLGQLAGQRLLTSLSPRLPLLAERACEIDDDALDNAAPAMAIASSRHETQYSRLFRS